MTSKFTVQNTPVTFTVQDSSVTFNVSGIGQQGPQGPAGPSGSGTVVVNNPTSYDVTADQSGTFFTNIGATGVTAALLPPAPSPFQSLTYTFFVGAAQEFGVNAQAGMTIQYQGNVSASGGTFYTNTQGNLMQIVLISATKWVVSQITGVWNIA